MIVDRASKSSNRRVDFSGATASITAEGGGAVGAQMAGSDAEGYGVPNVVRIAAPGLQPNVRYNVTVRNVVFEGTARDYEWWFRLVP